jgi:hypothetical protein
VRVLLVEDDDIGIAHALAGEVAVRIELDPDRHVWADEPAHPLDDVTLAVVAPRRDHGAVEAEQDRIDRQGRAELIEDLVAHALVIGLQHGAGRLGPEAGSLDEVEALLPRPPSRDP